MERFGLKEVYDVQILNYNTKKPEGYLSTLMMSSLDIDSNEVKSQGGRGNADLIVWDEGKSTKFAIQDALFSPKMFSLATGSKVRIGKDTIYMRQDTIWESDGASGFRDKGEEFPLIADGTGSITLAAVPLNGVSGITLYESKNDCGTPIALDTATLTTNVLKLASLAGKELVAYFQYESTATSESYTITSDSFPGVYTIVGKTIGRREGDSEDKEFQLLIPKGKLSSKFSLKMAAGNEPEPIDFEITALKDKGVLAKMTVIK